MSVFEKPHPKTIFGVFRGKVFWVHFFGCCFRGLGVQFFEWGFRGAVFEPLGGQKLPPLKTAPKNRPFIKLLIDSLDPYNKGTHFGMKYALNISVVKKEVV